MVWVRGPVIVLCSAKIGNCCLINTEAAIMEQVMVNKLIFKVALFCCAVNNHRLYRLSTNHIQSMIVYSYILHRLSEITYNQRLCTIYYCLQSIIAYNI